MAPEKKAAAAAGAMAELYVWDAVVAILEGSTAPRSATGQRAAKQVIGICQKECQRRLSDYDRALAALVPTAARKEDGRGEAASA